MANLTCLGVKVLEISDKPRDLCRFFPEGAPPQRYVAVALEDGRCLAVPASWIQRPISEETPA